MFHIHLLIRSQSILRYSDHQCRNDVQKIVSGPLKSRINISNVPTIEYHIQLLTLSNELDPFHFLLYFNVMTACHIFETSSNKIQKRSLLFCNSLWQKILILLSLQISEKPTLAKSILKRFTRLNTAQNQILSPQTI